MLVLRGLRHGTVPTGAVRGTDPDHGKLINWLCGTAPDYVSYLESPPTFIFSLTLTISLISLPFYSYSNKYLTIDSTSGYYLRLLKPPIKLHSLLQAPTSVWYVRLDPQSK